MHSKEEGFGSHLVEREDNSAASCRGKGEIAVVEKSFPTLVSEQVESDWGQEGGSAAVDMNAHAGCRNRVYDNNIPPSVPAAGGSSLCGFYKTILWTSGQINSLSSSPFIPAGGGGPPPEKGEILLLNQHSGALKGSEAP
jgi:hypothetical protein